jgi:UPF0271 protein
MQMKRVDLNCDLGEAFGPYQIGHDQEIMPLISSANVACGFHAGDPHVMRRTLELAKKHGVRVGAHPGLPDRLAFGRRRWEISASDLKDCCTYQIAALKGFAEACGQRLQHVIQHGALTAMMESDEALGRAFLESVREIDAGIVYLALPGSYLPDMARAMGLAVARVAFVDRAYHDNLQLVSRKQDGAVIHELGQVVERLETMLTRGVVKTIDGREISIAFESLMLHGDSPGAVEMARVVSETVRRLGIEVCPLAELI